jgi:hypothetical protein
MTNERYHPARTVVDKLFSYLGHRLFNGLLLYPLLFLLTFTSLIVVLGIKHRQKVKLYKIAI